MDEMVAAYGKAITVTAGYKNGQVGSGRFQPRAHR